MAWSRSDAGMSFALTSPCPPAARCQVALCQMCAGHAGCSRCPSAHGPEPSGPIQGGRASVLHGSAAKAVAILPGPFVLLVFQTASGGLVFLTGRHPGVTLLRLRLLWLHGDLPGIFLCFFCHSRVKSNSRALDGRYRWAGFWPKRRKELALAFAASVSRSRAAAVVTRESSRRRAARDVSSTAR